MTTTEKKSIEVLKDLHKSFKQSINHRLTYTLQSGNEYSSAVIANVLETTLNLIDKLQKENKSLEIIHECYKEMIEENDYISKDRIREEFEKFTAHNNCFNLGDIQLLLDNILEEE